MGTYISDAVFHVFIVGLPPEVNMKHRGLYAELQQLYTAITRARDSIFIFDEGMFLIEKEQKNIGRIIYYNCNLSTLKYSPLAESQKIIVNVNFGRREQALRLLVKTFMKKQ